MNILKKKFSEAENLGVKLSYLEKLIKILVNNMNLINIEEPNKPETTQKCLGIDFGTTNSVCSLKVNNKVVFIEDFNKKI